MAIDRVQWKMILESGAKGKALSAGYPDLLLRTEDIPWGHFGGTIHKDSAKIAAHHGWKGPIYAAQETFWVIGLDLDVVDRAEFDGCERIINLNEGDIYQGAGPDGEQTYINPLYLGEYDLVIDPGTSEHCFNVAQALVNLAGAVKVGGVISQALPMSMFNHGYWNVNPVALLDFYELNGFKIEKMVIRHPGGVFEPKPEDRGVRMVTVPDGAVNIITARRLEKKPFVWPQQKLP